jgi:PAS domain S-box-containing protein
MALLGRIEFPLTRRHDELQAYLTQMRSALPRVEVVDNGASTAKLILQVVETAGSGVLLADWNWRVTYANAPVEQFLAKQGNKAIGKKVWDLLPARFVVALEQRAAAAKGVQSELEAEFFDDATARWVLLNAFARDEGIAIFISDATKRKQAEETRRKSEARFRLLSADPQDMVFLFSLQPSPRFDYVSPACFALTGHKPEAFYTTSDLLGSLFHQDDRSIFAASFAQNHPAAHTLRITKPDGETRLVDLRVTPILDDAGRIIACEGIARDMTAQQSAEAELAQSERLYRTTVNALPDGIFLVSSTGAVQQILGRYEPERYGPKGVYLGKRLDEMFPGASGKEAMELTRLALYSRRTQTCEFDVNFGARTLSVEARFVPSGAEGVLVILRDISDRKQAQSALHETNRRLQQSRLRMLRVQEEVRRTVADQLHGTVQSKLLVVTRMLQEAARKDIPEDVRSEIASAVEIVEDAYKNDVRGIVKQLHPASIRFGLLPGLRSLVETAGGITESRLVHDEQHAELTAMLADGLSENVRLGAYRVVEEALNNIAKHSKATQVTLALTKSPGNYLTITITDNGEGFDERHVPPGYGLLTMEDHCTSLGGEFAVKSAPGQGTTVTASFPAARAMA